MSLFKDFALFIKEEKKWWLAPLIIILLVFGAILVFAQSSPLLQWLYPLF
ncbi:DUF5989 family protein [Planctomycetota bacterium]